MGFYLRYWDDFEWGSAYEVFKHRRLLKLYEREDVDLTKLDFLKSYKKDLEESLEYLQK